ncbi:MAG TPA: DNA recombination protein RmuC, partial [Bacteroidales bacterium]|nr:DNA recombination protein RmuC [Bacteroidales bacterium]
METTLLIIITALLLLAIVLIIALRNKGNNDLPQIQIKIDELQSSLSGIEKNLKEEFRLNRLENTTNAKADREELTKAIGDFRTEIMTSVKTMTDQNSSALEKLNQTLEQKVSTLIEKNMSAFNGFQESFDKNVRSFNELQKEKFELMESKQNELVKGTETKLDIIRATVEEKLEKTLSERLGQSFETVGKQLIEVQRGLGEMQTLAQDVGGLKRVLSNVKMRGGIGEVQLAMLLEQILAP